MPGDVLIMYFGVFALGVSLGSRMVMICCLPIYLSVVNKQFEVLEFVFDSVYVDLQYDEISLTFTAGSVSPCGVCSHLWSVCEVAMAPYVDVVVAVTVVHVLLFVMHVLLFVMHVLLFVCMLRL